MFVPVPPSSGLALAGRHRAGQPVRQPDHHRPGRHPQRCCAGPSRCAASPRTCTPRPGRASRPPTCPGTARPASSRTAMQLGQGARFEEDPQLTIADIDLDLLRQERARQGTFEDNRRVATPDAVYRTVEFTLDPPDGDLGLLRTVERFPFVPADPGATRPGLLRGVQHPGRRPGAAAAGDQHRQGGDRRVRRPRLHPRADRRGPRDGPARPAADQHPGLHHARLRHRRRHQVQRLDADGGAGHHRAASWTSGRPPGRCWRSSDHPFARGEEVYDVTFENVQAGLRTDYLFRLANHHDGDRARHRRPVRARAGLEHLRRRRPDVALQRQRRRAEDADPAPDPLGERARRLLRPGGRHPAVDPEHRDLTRADPGQGGRGPAEHREGDRPVRAAGLQPVLHAALRLPAVEDRVPRPPRLGRRRAGAAGRRASRRSAAARTTCPRSASG